MLMQLQMSPGSKPTLKTKVIVLSKPFFLALIMITSSLSAGCIFQDDSFEWPELVEGDCDLNEDYKLKCTKFLDNYVDFETPVASFIHPDVDELWILDLSGFIRAWDESSLRIVADLSDMISRCHTEQGLLGFAFTDDFTNTGTVLVSYVEDGPCDGPNESDLVLVSATIDEFGFLDKSSISILWEIEQPYRNHNGGSLQSIGNNQYLWGIGDGGDANDPHDNGQDNASYLGTMLLFSFDQDTINPVLDDSYVLHYGLRNPWKFDLDTEGRLWIADVGQKCWEEINMVSITQSSNLGWSEREGFYSFDSSGGCQDEAIHNDEMVDPILAYSHENGNCSVTGGFWMDWGPELLRDGYLYGDFCSGSIWLLTSENGFWSEELIGVSGSMIVGFGQDLNGDLLIFSWGGKITKISSDSN